MIGIEGTYDLGGGRGRATLWCTWSIQRIDRQLGRLLDINSAWRNPQEQERLYMAYRNYVNGNGPWAPIALPPEQSVHCNGEAIDTDDNNAAMTRVLNDNGWFHTVFRNGVLVEPWHYEYDYKRDKFFGGQAASSGDAPKPLEWDEMASKDEMKSAFREEASAVANTVLSQYVNRPHGLGGMPTPIKSASGALALVGEFSVQVLSWPADKELWLASLWAHGIRNGDITGSDLLADAHFNKIVENASKQGRLYGIVPKA